MATEGAPRRGWRLLGECTVVAALSSLIAAWLYRVWDADLRVPMTDGFDAKQVHMMIRTLQETGWWLHNPDLNAPFGMDYHDFPHGGENLQLLVLRGLVALTGDSGLTLNLWFLASFPLVALSAFLVCRYLRFSFKISLLIGLLYTFLPFHAFHEANQIYRSMYITAPLAALLLLWALEPVERWRTGTRRLIAAAAICVVLGSFETMVAAFTMALLAGAGVVMAVAHREPRRLIVHGALAGLIGVTFLVNQAPSLLYIARHGGNGETADRLPWESEVWGLKISKMVLPVHDGRTQHPIGRLAELGREAELGPIASEGGQALGIIGATGLVVALVRLLVRGVRRPRDDPEAGPDEAARPLDHLGLLILLAVLLGTISGVSFVLAIGGFAQVRMWNRIVLLIAFFSFLVVGTGLERLFRRWPRPALGAGVVAGLLVVGLLDMTSSQDRPYEAFEAQSDNDRDFVRGIEDRLPARAAVFQFPIIPFPEHPAVERMVDYDHFKGYLHSDDLRWSYGGIKGRPRADWQQRLVPQLPQDRVEAIAAIGFSGIWVDRFGYADDGAAVEGELAAILGRRATLVSDDRRLSFWDLRPFRRQLEDERSPARLRRMAEDVLGEPSPLTSASD